MSHNKHHRNLGAAPSAVRVSGRAARTPRLLKTALLGAFLTILPACEKGTDYSAFVKDPRPIVTSTEYLIAPPDTITISSKRVREINGHTEQIRPDGKITLPLLGSVFVTGKTVEAASAELEGMAREFYADADVSLRVVGYASKKIYVFGEVGSPGPYPYTGTNTVLGTLAIAQPTRLAAPSRIDILRPNKDGTLRKKMTIDLDRMVKKGDNSLDAVLEEGDIVYVPPNILATAGLALQQLLLPIQPAAATVKGPADIEASATGSASYGHPTGPTR
jgi:protein involved in polysaccharide export with SLBB domain